MTQRIAIVGAGLAGLASARVLRRAGCYVEVFEADRVIGGRIATTRLGATNFDHGAPCFSVRGDRFRTYVEELVSTGYAQRWTPRLQAANEGANQVIPWFVGTPGMASAVRPLAESVRIHTGRRVHTLKRLDKAWYLWFDDETSAGPFAAVVIAVPPAEARLLLGRIESLAAPIQNVRMAPTWSLMVRLEEPVLPDYDVFSDMSQIIRWVASNASKPGRSGRGETVVIHAGQAWSRETEDGDPEQIAEELWAELCHTLSLPPVRPTQMLAHLWRHGLVESPLGESFLFSRTDMVGVCGDWCLGRLAEHAFDSGTLLGKAIVDNLR